LSGISGLKFDINLKLTEKEAVWSPF